MSSASSSSTGVHGADEGLLVGLCEHLAPEDRNADHAKGQRCGDPVRIEASHPGELRGEATNLGRHLGHELLGAAAGHMAVQSLPPPAVILAADYERAHAHDGAELVDEPALVGVGLVGLEQRLDEIRVRQQEHRLRPERHGLQGPRGLGTPLGEEAQRITLKCGNVREPVFHR
jgi:hypothetical protein